MLDPLFPCSGGLRVPGSMDGFELAVRAIWGQQITVAAARTITQRIVAHFGEPLLTPYLGLNRLFPAAEVMAQVGGEALGQLGVVKSRQGAMAALAQAVLAHKVQLVPGADAGGNIAALKADAFPAGDVATPFQQAVWRALLTIPRGQTTSYGELSQRCGHATAIRAVDNPASLIINRLPQEAKNCP